MSPLSGEQCLATILKHDTKTTSYKIALLRAINDVVLLYPDISGQDVAVPLTRLAELWVAYYWPFADARAPIYQGGRAVRGEEGGVRSDVGFRPALTQLRLVWEEVVQLSPQPADGFFLLTEMRTPRRRATYPMALQQAYQQTVSAMVKALQMPIKYAGPGEWAVFAKPKGYNQLFGTVPLPGTQPTDSCVIIPASLWEAFQRLSLYVEALCLHEWALFTEQVRQEREVGRGLVYSLLTARPDNRRPLSWERNQVDILLHEKVVFTCPWTLKRLTKPQDYDLDHLLPLAVYPVNELWNLLPVDRTFNQQVKRDKVPDAGRLAAAEPWLAAAYGTYLKAPALQRAVREDAALRFAGLGEVDFAAELANRTVRFIDAVAVARYVRRF
ncbi:HNH endonuclease domain-containing protein [Hymenobacter bucti]|uniref:HNH endonuclease domain-containing protein n=1 Tax=Hymenobacter bucti TaxID=1844114 RepID=A0ABW4QXJ2_9BACT